MTSFFSVPPDADADADADADPGFGLVVYGATPAGILASVVAARAGLRVALLEPSSHLGGMATSGLCATDVSDRRLVRGVVREVFQRCGAAYGRDIEWKAESRVMAVVFRTMLAEAGVVLRLGTPILDLGKIGPRIVWASLAGGRRLHASAWIDATYEGDLLPLADVSHTAGCRRCRAPRRGGR